MREILTIQLGNYANFVGTHWWNLQTSNFTYDQKDLAEINHDVLFREGENMQKQVTFTPRLLVADLKGAVGRTSEQSVLHDVESADTKSTWSSQLWDNDRLEVTSIETLNSKALSTEKPNEKPNESGEARNLPSDEENDVKSWIDHLLPLFHPRTLTVVKEYSHNSESQPFDVFTYGRNLWNMEQFSDDFSERMRSYVEECDLIQGFHVLVDSINGFAGLGASCVQYLRDEYGKSILTFPCMDFNNAAPSAADFTKVINTALCWQHIGEYSSLYSPLSCAQIGWPFGTNPRKFNNVTYRPELNYHTSAILATALDTLTLRYRTKKYPNVTLSDLCADLNKLGRKAAATSLSLPFPMKMKTDLIDLLDECEVPPWTILTPSCDITTDRNMQSIALRGIPENRLKRPIHQANRQISMPAYRCSSVHEMMTLYLSCACNTSYTYFSNIAAPLKITEPYPKIFNNNVTEDGNIADWPMATDVKSVAVMAGIHSSDSIAAMYESLIKQIKRINIKKFHAFLDFGLDEDEFAECVHNLEDCKEAYEDKFV